MSNIIIKDDLIPQWDLDLFTGGEHRHIYQYLGARLREVNGETGVLFAVWAPAATRVSVVGDFNEWKMTESPMRRRGASGVWELFVPGIEEGERYKFAIVDRKGQTHLKADPYALSSELRPRNASVVANYEGFSWTDSEWIKKREEGFEEKKMLIYEVHLGSWKKNNGEFYTYLELAPLLADYVTEKGFTHIELLPITEHPLDESWGYQVTGYYAPTVRYGSLQDFQWMVNYFHERGIGVILDWVPAHFPTDSFSLGHFDGRALYEHEDPRKSFHPHWKTLVFEFGRPKVANFLLGSALFWLREMHIDGLRVDAVASMLYLDYGRSYGQWIPNYTGGNENWEAVHFFQRLNTIVHEEVPGALMIAEESTAFPGITKSPECGGLGFDMKWNMGWMNDTLTYFKTPPEQRRERHHYLTFGQVYMYNERFLLPFSHDECVHGKGSLLQKMPGTLEERFANLRLLYSYLICHPGKKLLFMGGEIGQFNEWDVMGEVSFEELKLPLHAGFAKMVQDLNHLYQNSSPLYEKDCTREGFEWVDFSDAENSIIAYLRKSQNESFLVIHNFQTKGHSRYTLPFNKGPLELIFSTEQAEYGGQEVPVETPSEGFFTVPPLSTTIYKCP